LTLSIIAELLLQDGTKQLLKFYLSAGKEQLQELVKKEIGYLPSNCNACFWMENDTINIALDKDASPGKIAHEAHHAAIAAAQIKKLDPGDYTLVRPNKDDFGYMPAELCADLCEQIVNTISKHMKFAHQRGCSESEMKDILKDAEAMRKYRTAVKNHFDNNDEKRRQRP
jgi:hypothetical protein